MDTVPLSAILALLLCYLIAGFTGGYVATALATKPAPRWPAWVVSGVFTAGGIANFVMIPSPIWVVVAGITIIFFSPQLGYFLRK